MLKEKKKRSRARFRPVSWKCISKASLSEHRFQVGKGCQEGYYVHCTHLPLGKDMQTNVIKSGNPGLNVTPSAFPGRLSICGSQLGLHIETPGSFKNYAI